MRLVTLTTITTVPQARVLAASLKRHHPGWRHDLVLIASRKVSAGTGSISLEAAAPELDFDLETLIACNDEQDLIAMVLPRFLKVYAKSCGEPVMHLPPTAWVTGDLQPVVQALPRRGLVLVPRTLGDPPDDGLEPSLDALERVGRVSDTAMAVDGGQLADGFLDWWGDRVEKMLGALTGAPGRGRPEDRPWLARALELGPARFGATLLDDPGCNVSMWNLHGRTLEQTSAGTMVDGHWPLRFMDLDGFQAEHPYRLSSNASRVRVSRSNALRALCAAYAGELEKAGWDATSELRDVGRRLANGLIYDDTLRLLHGRAMALGEHFSDLFGEHGSHAFTRWLEGPAPRGAAYGITRYVFYRILGERPDVMRAYPDLDGPDGREYVAWCWAFGQH